MSKKKTDKSKQDKSGPKPRIVNKKARFNYQLLEKLEAGIALVGTEVKSLRQGRASMEDAYATIRDGELYLLGCNIMPYDHGNIMNHDPQRPRKLLVHKRELKKIESKLVQKGLTLVPVKIYFSRGLAKVEVALARGKSTSDKRQAIKDRDMERDLRRTVDKYR